MKVWKDLGLHRRDHHGNLVLLDDERLAPLWAEAAGQGIPVAVHTADPKAFFDPIDEHNERLEQLLRYPHWSFAGPEFPAFERLIDALETVVAANPETTFVGVHGGCYPENLGRVGDMLDRYPNYHIDISARLPELGRQPRAARALFTRHRDRVLFGTDTFPPDERSYRLHYRFLETGDEWFPHSTEEIPEMGRWGIGGARPPRRRPAEDLRGQRPSDRARPRRSRRLTHHVRSRPTRGRLRDRTRGARPCRRPAGPSPRP